jgi:MFS family permease
LVLGVAVVYGIAAAFPDLATQAGDGNRIRMAAAVVAVAAASVFVGQLLATIGLTAGWRWARPLATLVCVVWALTCIGLPFALLALNSIWRGRPRPQAAPRWP